MTARVLIVEDEIFVATDMAETLSEYGYDCVGIADETASAMRLARRDVDIALVDVNLCDGATGPAIGAALAQKYGIKVIFVTANPRQLGAGVPGTIGVLTKPCDIALVGEAIEFALQRQSAADIAAVTAPPGLELFRPAA
jgi:two-component system, response regulator PdtaR